MGHKKNAYREERAVLSRRAFSSEGFTLIELLVVVAILGVLTALVIPRVSGLVGDARVNKTKDRLAIIRTAIIGNGTTMTGYEADTGSLPDTLDDLLTKPASLSTYDPFAKSGWNGPYLKDGGSGDAFTDSWNRSLVYDKSGRKVISYGADGAAGGSGEDADIVIAF